MIHARHLRLFLPLLLALTSSASAHAGAFTIHGTVISEISGDPVAQATVWLVQQREPRKTQTDAKGSYVFRKVEAGPMELVVLAKDAALGGFRGFAAGDADVTLTTSGDPATLQVRIVDSQLVPIPGAKVRAILVNDAFVISAEDLADKGFPVFRSNDQGVVAIPNLPAAGFVKLIVGHYKYADSFVSYLPVTGRQQDIILAEGVKVQGRVQSPANKPLSDARVSIFQTGTSGTREVADARTDPEGFFSARIPYGEYGVVANHGTFAASEPVGLVVEEGTPPESILLTMREPRHLRGKILDPDGKAMGGVRVLYRSEGAVYGDTLSDTTGNFDLRVAETQGVLNVVPPLGYMLPGLRDIPVNLREASQADVGEIRLKPLPQVTGQVLDANGNPAPNALVSMPDLPLPVWVLSDDEGQFTIRLREEPDAETVRVVADHATLFARGEQKIDLRKNAPLRIQLAPYTPSLTPPERQPNTNDLSALLGKPAPPLESKEWFNGDAVNLETLKGNVVLLFFWAGFLDTADFYNTMEEVRALQALLKDVPDVQFVSIHDALSEASEIQDYIAQMGVTFPVGRDADPFMTFDRYGIKFLPQIVLIDRQGIVRYDQTQGHLLEYIKDLRRR